MNEDLNKKKLSDEEKDLSEDQNEVKDSVEEEIFEAESVENDSNIEDSSLENDVSNDYEDLKNTLVRLQADFNNYRNRVNKEKQSLVKYATEGMITDILSVLDNFDRALGPESEDESEYNKGFRLIRKELFDILQKNGLEVIESDGKVFDPNLHNAVVMEDSDLGEGIIIETLQTGYKVGDKVIRPSYVKVSK
ncbi:nucleotide exchange factor GrpE [Citroniella saccharovorans]|uniref:Protein GrpE n=1 Tax=Citroniella saccharovorans TaxID=2053367 RepID=A0AAW9MQN2_9FIRM|nr:nucleotide exchange factor GrpE [Citroniella saccharovorans]MEB3429923.1 nucleotide exchange factor GrpE [Citroniella saccharovorans]